MRGAHGDSSLSFTVPTMTGHGQKAAIYKAGKEPSPDPDLAGTPIWDPQPPALGEIDGCCQAAQSVSLQTDTMTLNEEALCFLIQGNP